MIGMECIETGDPDDIEPGCMVWSNTHQDSQGWVGGVVLSIDPIARTVRVLPNVTKKGPRPVTLALDELNMEATSYDTRSAGVTAVQLWAWLTTLTTKKARDNADAREWSDVATKLQGFQDGGLWLPDAEARYQAARAEMKALAEHRRYDSDEFAYSGCVVCDSNGDSLGWPCPTMKASTP